MPYDSGSEELCPECHLGGDHKMDCSYNHSHPLEKRALRSRERQRKEINELVERQRNPVTLTEDELTRIADGEPFCFRCGKPASSFEEYKIGAEDEGLANAWQYVIQEEGTYNDANNRFACDQCYIEIGMPVGGPGNDYGWKAP